MGVDFDLNGRVFGFLMSIRFDLNGCKIRF
jgi:hypothetical protein